MKTHFVCNQKPKITRTLFYKLPRKDGYSIIATDAKKKVGVIYLQRRKVDCMNFLEIDFLGIMGSERRKGYGSEALEFAKNLSKNENCGGRLILTADITPLEVKIAPHAFYRKNGFTCNDKVLLKKIDKFVKEKKEMSYKDAKTAIMFYVPKQETIFEKIKKFFKK